MARLVCAVVLVCVVVGVCAAADAPTAKPLAFQTKRVVVFKDGYSLFVKEAPAVADADRIVFTDKVPDQAILGAFWAVPSKGRILSMVAGKTDKETEQKRRGTCLTMWELLKANVGRRVRIERQNGNTLSGTLKMVLEEEKPVQATAAPPPALSRRSAAAITNYFPQRPARPTTRPAGKRLFVVETGRDRTVLPSSDVKMLAVEGLVTAMERKSIKKESVKRPAFQLDKEATARGTTLSLMHFGPGIRWIPTYRIDIADKRAARMNLQGELLNEAEDVVGASVSLVVGVPNFRFKDVISPLSLERTLRNALRQAAPQLMSQQVSVSNYFSNAAIDLREMERRGRDRGAGDIRLPAELAAAGTQDLYVYSLKNLTLLKGQRAAVPIFTAGVPYRHLYTWDVKIQRSPGIARSSSRASPVKLARNDVWHQVELTNNTDKPWTTGAALVMDGAMPLSQDLLTYTPSGGRVLVPVTVAVDVRGTYAEKEVGRDGNALRFDANSYMRVRKTGTLTLANYKAEEIEAVVTCEFGGHCDSATDDGDITLTDFRSDDWKNYRGHPAVNQHSTVRWTAKLKKGETKTFSVTYYYFAR